MKTWKLLTRESRPEPIAQCRCQTRSAAVKYFSILKGLSTRVLQNIYRVQVQKNSNQ